MTLIILIEVFSQNSFMQGIYVRKKKRHYLVGICSFYF